MKDLTLIAWLTQLGLTVIFPLIGFIALSLWLFHHHNWGSWVIWAGVILGAVSAIDGFRTCLKAMSRLTEDKSRDDTFPASFNDHD